MKSKNNSNNKIFLGVLIAALIALGAFSYFNNQKHVNTETALLEEKESILKDLTIMENQYNDAISKNTEYSNELEVQRNNIIRFRDSLKRVKTTNWKAIKFYKNKIATLNTTNSRLFRINDSIVKRNELLNYENQDLTEQKDSLSTNLNEQITFNDTLVKQNLTLAKKVSIAEVVKAGEFRMTTYKERNNGEYSVTDKARRVDAFKIGFTLIENLIAKEKDITAHVILKGPSGNLVVDNGTFILSDDTEIHFSEKTVVSFKKSAIITDIILNTNNQKLEKGIYTATIYLNNKLVASIKKVLK
jgi:hypothetical protein